MVNLEYTPDRDILHVKWTGGPRNAWMDILGKVKNLKGARFNHLDKTWIVLNTDENLMALAAMGKATNNLVPKQPSVPSSLKRCPKKYKDFAAAPEVIPPEDIKDRQKRLIDSVTLDGPLVKGLRNYQIDFIKFMVARDGRALLADDMGTGKTLQSLAWLAYANAFPALIVVTAPTKLQWEREYHRWLADVTDSEPVQVLKGQSGHPLIAGSTVIINWDILHYWVPYLKKYGFKCLIGDEAQAIGNPSSQRAKAFRTLAGYIPQCIVMSGTPARSKPAQYWSMINCVDPKMFPDYQAYLWRYCDPKFTPYSTQPEFKGATNVKELHGKLMRIMLRRTKSEIMTELPSKQIEVIPLEVDPAIKKAYDGEESMLSALGGNPSELRLKVSELGRTAYLMKEKALVNWTTDLLETTGEKVVIFCWHRDVVELLETAFAKYHPAKIYGETTLKQREEQKRRFIEDPNCRVIVGNIQALGTGVDGLQKVCCKAIFAEFANTATDSMQAEDRLHRGGQENPVTIYYTCAKDTVDEDMMVALDEKRKVLDSVLDGKDTDSGDLLVEILARRGIIC